MADFAVSDPDFQIALNRTEIRAHLKALLSGDMDVAHRIYHKDAVLTLPLIGNAITGRDKIKDARSKSSRKFLKVNAATGQGDIWVSECLCEEDEQKLLVVNIMVFSGDQIAREREYSCAFAP
jgi:hypothetical protein